MTGGAKVHSSNQLRKENRNSGGKSTKKFAFELVKESNITLVSNILATSNSNRRLFKLTVLLLCLGGFLYQLTAYLQMVLQHPTRISVHIVQPSTFIVPAYTFCNNNGIKRSTYCEKFPDNCIEPDESFCEEYFPYCGKNGTKVPKKQFYYLENKASFNGLGEIQQSLNEFLVVNENDFGAEPSGPFPRLTDVHLGDGSGEYDCYSLQSFFDNGSGPYETENVNEFYKYPINTLQFRAEEDDVFVPGNRAGIIFSIHSPYLLVNPFIKGIFMKAGRKYKIYVTIEEQLLMKYPYDTDCIDYMELWEANNRTGPTMQEMCRQKCVMDLYLNCYNCTWIGILYPQDAEICDPGTTSTSCTGDDVMKMLECVEDCKKDCRRTKYQYTVQELYNIQFDENEEMSEDSRKFVYVEVYLNNEDVLVLNHKPKYVAVEVFGSIGGFIGGWLGISIVGISDFLECVVQILRFYLQKSF